MNRLTQKLLPISTLTLLLTTLQGGLPPHTVLRAWVDQPAIAQTAESISTRVYQQASPAVVTIKNGVGHGSGFVVSADGLIITNAHVVADSPRIVTVLFNDGRQVSADVIGFADNGVDLAALKIYEQNNLPYLPLAPQNAVEVGQNIFVIGTPLTEDYQNTLTSGMISRLNPQDGILQHDANTNAGNSGGPVLNSQGQVLGVHFSGDIGNVVYGNTGRPIGVTKSGINFAVAGNRLQTFLQAVKTGKASRLSTLPNPQQQSTIPTLSGSGKVISAALEKTDTQLNNQRLIDLYQFEGKAGQSVSISLESDEFNPVLQLFYVDQSGPQPKYVPIAKNDDRGPADFAAQLNLPLPKDGLYYIGAIASQEGALGNYKLQAKGI